MCKPKPRGGGVKGAKEAAEDSEALCKPRPGGPT